MRHIVELLLRVLDRLDDIRRQFFEGVGKGMLFGRGFAGLGAGFGGGGDGAVRVEATEGAVAFLEDAVAFFDHGFDVFDDFFFVELFFWGAFGFVEALWGRGLVRFWFLV